MTSQDAIPARSRPGGYASVYGDVYGQFPQECRRHRAADMTLLKVDQGSHETVDPPVDDVVLRLVTGGALRHSSVDCGDGPRALSGRRGSFYLAPAQAEAAWQAQGAHEVLLFALPEARLLQIVGAVAPKGTPLDRFYGRDVHDPTISALMLQMWESSALEGPGTPLILDGLLMTVIGTLLQNGDARPAGEADAPPLDALRLDRVTDWIDAHLAETVRISDLAAIACLSPYHFCRRFRAATDLSPHAFVTRRRVEAGAAMLRRGDLSLAEIAHACGFSSQAHFTRQFKAHMGRPPGRYRAALET